MAYRGNLYYKLPQCTVAEPQTALSFQWVCLCMQVVLLTYSVCVCVYSMLVPLVKMLVFSYLFDSCGEIDLDIIWWSTLLLHVSSSTHTHRHTQNKHTRTCRLIHARLVPVSLHESGSNTSHSKHEACFYD